MVANALTAGQMALDDLRVERNVATPGLRVGAHLTIQQRFEEWLETDDGRFVFRWVRDHALSMRRRGFKRYGIGALWEAARYARDVQVGPSGGYALNDHYRSRLARRLMAEVPELDSFFETRRLTA